MHVTLFATDVHNRAKRRKNHNKVLTHSILKLEDKSKIRNELEKYRQHAGLPSCCATHFKFICVGTSRGVVLVFDHFEALVMALGKFSDTKKRGAVTCLDMSPEGDHLVAGHQNSQIVLWDVLSKTVLKLLHDGRSSSPVTCLWYTKKGKNQLLSANAAVTCVGS